METLDLKHPIMIDGKQVNALSYDFEALTITDIMEAEKRKSKKMGFDIVSAAAEVDYSYHLCVFLIAASKAMGVSITDVERVQGTDAFVGMRLARNFMLGGSESGDPETSEPQ